MEFTGSTRHNFILGSLCQNFSTNGTIGIYVAMDR